MIWSLHHQLLRKVEDLASPALVVEDLEGLVAPAKSSKMEEVLSLPTVIKCIDICIAIPVMPMANQRRNIEHLLYFPIAKIVVKSLSGLSRRGIDPNISTQNLKFLCNQIHSQDTLLILRETHLPIHSSTYASLLHSCIKKKYLYEGKLIYAHMNEIGFMPTIIFHNTLVSMYTKCGSLRDARKLFDEMPNRDVCSCSVMIAAYYRHGFVEEALEMSHQMRSVGFEPNHFTYASIISSCTKCGHIEKAQESFDKIPKRIGASWNTMIPRFSDSGKAIKSMNFFFQMRQTRVMQFNSFQCQQNLFLIKVGIWENF